MLCNQYGVGGRNRPRGQRNHTDRPHPVSSLCFQPSCVRFRDVNWFISFHTPSFVAEPLWVVNRGECYKAIDVPRSLRTKALIESAGYETIAVDVSEFRKIDGGLSSLSLRFL